MTSVGHSTMAYTQAMPASPRHAVSVVTRTDVVKSVEPPPLVGVLWQAVSTVLFDVPMTEVLSLNKALAACHVPYPPTLENWILPGLQGRSWMDHAIVFSLIFAPMPLLPEMCLGLALAFLAYAKVAMVLTFIGFPFCFGLIFLVWAHTWCFIWWPAFFSYYIIRGVVYGVPIRCSMIYEGFHLLVRKLRGEPVCGTPPASPNKPVSGRSPQMASISTQAAWVAASAASAAGVDAGWRWVGKDIASPHSSPNANFMSDPPGADCEFKDQGSSAFFPMLPTAQVDEDTAATTRAAGTRLTSPARREGQKSAMASAG